MASFAKVLKNLQLSPKTPAKQTTKYSVESPSSGRTLVMNGSQSPNPRRNMKSSTLSSSSSSKGSPKLQRVTMKVMKSPMKGSPKIMKTSFSKAKVMKAMKVVQRAVKKMEWKPTDPNSVMVMSKSYYAPFRAVHGQVKMLKIDLGEAAYLHRDQQHFNKSYGETCESWRSFLIQTYRISLMMFVLFDGPRQQWKSKIYICCLRNAVRFICLSFSVLTNIKII